jgi:hypothetical protein
MDKFCAVSTKSQQVRLYYVLCCAGIYRVPEENFIINIYELCERY